jgi:hypothetical protein
VLTQVASSGHGHPGIIRIVYVTGSEYEQGYQHGYQLAEEIEFWTKFVWDYVSDVGTREEILGYIDKYLAKQMKVSPEFLDQVKGISDGVKAKGSNVTFDEVKLLQWFWTVQSHPPIGCSSFGAWGKATKDNKPLYAQNMDTKAFPWAISCALVAHFPNEGHPWFTTGEPGKVAASTGMNSAGLLATIQYAPTYAPSESSYGLEGTQILYLILKNCSTTEEAKNVVLDAPRAKAQNYIFMDASSKMCVVEATGSASHAIVRRAGDFGESDFMVASNHFVSPKWLEWGYQKPDPPWGVDGPDNSWTRYQTILKLIEQNLGRIDSNVAMNILTYHSYWDGDAWVEDASTGRTPCHHGLDMSGAIYSDTFSTLYLPETKEFCLTPGNPCGNWPTDRLLGTDGYVRWFIGDSPDIMEAKANTEASALLVAATERLIRGLIRPDFKNHLEDAKWHYFEGMIAHTNAKVEKAENNVLKSLTNLGTASQHFAYAQAHARYAMNKSDSLTKT